MATPDPHTRPETLLEGRWSSRDSWKPRTTDATDSVWRDQIDPGSGKVLARVRDMAPLAIEEHVGRIRSHYEAAGEVSTAERAGLLKEVAAAVDASAEDLGEIDALCTGKRLADSTATARAGATVLRYYADLLDGDPFSEAPDPIQAGSRQFVDRVPVGLAACVLPWNFPLSQGCARLAMLYASGNAGIFKGSELAQPPLLALEEVVLDAGLPDWAFSVVTGGPEAGQALTEADEVDAICFTGGVPTGIAVARTAMSELKRVVLELGGKTPFVVFADADLDAALEVGLKAAFNFQGQACNAGSLLMVQAEIFDQFVERLAGQANELQIGHQLAEDTEIGPMISAAQRERVAGMVDAAVSAGARLHAGGEAVAGNDGFYYRPTILSSVPDAVEAATDEVFGPAVIAYPFEHESEIVQRVNGSPFGLAATIWTQDRDRANRMRRALRTGQLYINSHGQIPPNVPWGGFRLSGLGRLYGLDGLYAFTEARSTFEMTQQGW